MLFVVLLVIAVALLWYAVKHFSAREYAQGGAFAALGIAACAMSITRQEYFDQGVRDSMPYVSAGMMYLALGVLLVRAGLLVRPCPPIVRFTVAATIVCLGMLIGMQEWWGFAASVVGLVTGILLRDARPAKLVVSATKVEIVNTDEDTQAAEQLKHIRRATNPDS